MRFHAFMAAIFLLIAFGIYAIATRQTAGSLCRDTGLGIMRMARATDSSNEAIAGLWLSIESVGRSIRDACE